MQIRKAVSLDAQAVFDLRNTSIRGLCKGFYPDELLVKWTSGTEPSVGFTDFVCKYMYVAEVGGTVVGCGAIDLAKGQIDAVFVTPECAKSGVGRKIMQFLEKVAIENGLNGQLQLDSTLNAASFYRKLGFTGEGLSQYHSPRGFSLDCVKMQKILSDDGIMDNTSIQDCPQIGIS
jgi:N-acetylglutamate synthase-like GNAT family acetyltransferase